MEMSHATRERSDKALVGSMWQQAASLRTILASLCRSFGVEVALQEEPPQRSLEGLQGVCEDLEANLQPLGAAFERWGTQRAEESLRSSEMGTTIEALREDSGQTRERLHHWREMLKENTAIVEALENSLIA